MIRTNADMSDPVRTPDPIAFIYVLVYVLWGLVPLHVVERRGGDISEVMNEMAKIVSEVDGLDWLDSRKQCVGWSYDHLRDMDLIYSDLSFKLRTLGLTVSESLPLWVPHNFD